MSPGEAKNSRNKTTGGIEISCLEVRGSAALLPLVCGGGGKVGGRWCQWLLEKEGGTNRMSGKNRLYVGATN